MLTLTLLHPEKQIPLQQWQFENETVIRIGRSPDNQVILHDLLVSRLHLELRLGDFSKRCRCGTLRATEQRHVAARISPV